MNSFLPILLLFSSFSLFARSPKVGQKANYFSWDAVQRISGEIIAVFDDETVKIYSRGFGITEKKIKNVGLALSKGECLENICVGDRVKYSQAFSYSSANRVETVYDNGFVELESSISYEIKKVSKLSKRI